VERPSLLVTSVDKVFLLTLIITIDTVADQTHMTRGSKASTILHNREATIPPSKEDTMPSRNMAILGTAVLNQQWAAITMTVSDKL
jgi:hypothetical protein